ncbi:hypothetical protein GCM10009745_40760 [Kribbella yunnanensis]|uniref:Uncharacterized protein n=1 Tax=Kribbella yunnanensis TaxID=190194 RepID=A0ABN2HPM7_9ACTN
MQFREFSAAYNTAKRRIQREGAEAVAPAEKHLEAMLPELESDEDRRVGGNLIKRLPRYAVPAEPPTALMLEAMAVEREAFESPGTAEERIAIMAEARRRIFEIAERAPADDAPSIRGLTRGLEHLEDNLRDPYWPFDGPDDPDRPRDSDR